MVDGIVLVVDVVEGVSNNAAQTRFFVLTGL